ncbi:hypothetical protein T12_16469 [Trichinella patagoniensis]|uniref:Uncharacterized protein n=1 Tax=Trichinella patagoniensis TaxID=990121 RepID=A0A0V0Z8Z0_9BILA|nr:hypothetical protein T12_16469 [Trichinella patagoniensis]
MAEWLASMENKLPRQVAAALKVEKQRRWPSDQRSITIREHTARRQWWLNGSPVAMKLTKLLGFRSTLQPGHTASCQVGDTGASRRRL